MAGLKKLYRIVLAAAIVMVSLTVFLLTFTINPRLFAVNTAKILDGIYYMNYDVSTIGDDLENRNVQYGYELFVNTPKYLGPDSNKPYAGKTVWRVIIVIFLPAQSPLPPH